MSAIPVRRPTFHSGSPSGITRWLDLREHAVFTLHNLLEDNEENQNVVNNIQPSERRNQDRMLQR
jgi:hypothetical protein